MVDTLTTARPSRREHAETHDAACHAWLHTIALLHPQSALRASCTGDGAHAARAHAPIVTVIERPSATTAVVSWRDATHCRYGAQVWTLGLARAAGVCALTGQPIAKADTVYRPQRTRTPALNADAMIRAQAMHEACLVLAAPTAR